MKKVNKRPALSRGKVSPHLPVPDHIPKPPYVDSNILPEIASEYQIHDSEGIARMRAACELAARVLNFAGTLVKVRFPPFSIVPMSFIYLVFLQVDMEKEHIPLDTHLIVPLRRGKPDLSRDGVKPCFPQCVSSALEWGWVWEYRYPPKLEHESIIIKV